MLGDPYVYLQGFTRKFNKNVLHFYVYRVHVYVYVCVHMYTCISVRGPKVDTESLPLLISILSIEA